MPLGENDYKEWQEGYEDLNEEWDENWSEEEKLNHLENMKIYHDQYVSYSNLFNKTFVPSLLVGEYPSRHKPGSQGITQRS